MADAGEEQLFEVLPIIFLVFAYLDDAILNNVGHNYLYLVHIYARFLATPKLKQVWLWLFGLTKTFDFLPNSMEKRKMLHRK